MSDAPKGQVSFSGAPGQGAGGSSEGETQASGAVPAYITMDQAQELVNNAVEAALRRAQSMTDKSAARVESKLAELQQNYQQLTGHTSVPDDVQARLRQQAEQAVAGATGADEQGNANQTAQAGAQTVDDLAAQLYKRHGIDLSEDDPEAKAMEYKTEAEFLTALDQALAAKAKRIGAEAPKTPPNPARMPALGGAGGKRSTVLDNYDPLALIKQGLND